MTKALVDGKRLCRIPAFDEEDTAEMEAARDDPIAFP